MFYSLYLYICVYVIASEDNEAYFGSRLREFLAAHFFLNPKTENISFPYLHISLIFLLPVLLLISNACEQYYC